MKKLAVFLFAALLSVGAFAQQRAALYMTDSSNVAVGKVLKPIVMERLKHYGDYTIVERTEDFLRVLSKEHAYQRGGAVNDQQIARLGAQFGVDVVFAISVTQVGEDAFVNARVIDVTTAKVGGNGFAVVKTMGQLPGAADTLAKKMLFLD